MRIELLFAKHATYAFVAFTELSVRVPHIENARSTRTRTKLLALAFMHYAWGRRNFIREARSSNAFSPDFFPRHGIFTLDMGLGLEKKFI